MTGQRDIDEAITVLEQIKKLIPVAQAALISHRCSGLFISTDLAAAQASPHNPYGPPVPLASLRDREHYDGREVAEGAEPDDQSPVCDCGWQGDAYGDVTR